MQIKDLQSSKAAEVFLFKASDFSFDQFSSYAAYFDTEIAQLMPELEARIKANHTHGNLNDLHRGKAGSELFLAITKAKHVWDYLEWNKSIPKESIHPFQQDLPTGCDENKAMLLLLCKSKDLSKEVAEMSDKKSLQL